MPRAKNQVSDLPSESRPEFVPDEIVRDVATLLRTIGDMIKVRNQNGRRSNQFCLLCKEARRLRIQCPHTQIWQITEK